jgi:hypothetical protein
MRIVSVLVATAALAAVAAPPASADEFYGVTGDQLVRFDSLDPTLRNPLPLTGLAAGEHVVAIDVRPTTGGLYGVTRKSTLTDMRLVRIDQQSGAVTAISGDVNIGFFNPAAGLDIRPDGATADVTAGLSALRFDIATGAVTVLPAASGNPIVGLAWTAPSGATPLILGVRVTNNDLVLYNPDTPSALSVHTLGITLPANTGLDYAPDGTLWMYAEQASDSDLWRVNISQNAERVSEISASLSAFCVRGTGPGAFASSTFGASEGDGTAIVTIRRDPPYDGPGKVAWSTADGTATAGQDYTAGGGEVTFARNQATANVSVPILEDSAVEGGEQFAVKLTSVEGVGAGPDATVRIADDDAPAAPPGGGGGGSPPGGGGTGDGGSGGGGGAGPARDTSAPVVLVLPLSAKLGKKLSLPFGVSEAARTTFTLQLSAKDAKRLKLKRAVGTVTLSARLGVNKAVLRLAKKTVAALKKSKKLVLTGVLTATDAAGNRRSVTVKITLRR